MVMDLAYLASNTHSISKFFVIKLKVHKLQPGGEYVTDFAPWNSKKVGTLNEIISTPQNHKCKDELTLDWNV